MHQVLPQVEGSRETSKVRKQQISWPKSWIEVDIKLQLGLLYWTQLTLGSKSCGKFPLMRRRTSFLTQTYLILWRFCQVLSKAADSASLQLGGWLSWQSISWLLSNPVYLATLILFTLSIDLNYVIVSNYSYLQGFQNSFYQSFGHSSSDHPGQSSKMVRRHEGIM